MFKPIAVAVMGVSLGVGGTLAMAKAHDQGVADGTRIDPSNLRGGVVASHDVAGVGRDANGNFLGVADSGDPDVNYGQDVVQGQVANDTRRIKPCGVGSKDPCD